jgi:hypothetical protein
MTNPEKQADRGGRTDLDSDTDLDSLMGHLIGAGLPLEKYGIDGAKTVHHLLQEIHTGDSKVSFDTSGNVYREVKVLWLDVFCSLEDGQLYRLKEDRQVFKDGRANPVKRRNLSSSLGEKLKPDEEPEASISRTLSEELAITAEPAGVYFLETEQTLFTPDTYPGLESTYTHYKYVVTIPPSAFNPEGYIEDQEDKTNYYVWELLN